MAHVVIHEVKSDAALFFERLLIIVPEYVVSFSTVKETPAIMEGDAEGDAVLEMVLETLDELETTDELEITDELETLEELEMLTEDEVLDGVTTFWYMFNPLDPPQIWVELPAQGILQRPSEIGLDPVWIVLPQ